MSSFTEQPGIDLSHPSGDALQSDLVRKVRKLF